jgi:hypothetical protein
MEERDKTADLLVDGIAAIVSQDGGLIPDWQMSTELVDW